MNGGPRVSGRRGRNGVAALALVCLASGMASSARAQAVQALTGRAEPMGNTSYLLRDLKRGRTVQVYVEATSGNLDPLAGITREPTPADALVAKARDRLDAERTAGRDALDAIPAFLDEIFLVWDDDGGTGYDAAFSWTVPADGTYQLVVIRSPYTQSAGEYRLLVGIDSPEVLTGRAQPTGDRIAVLDEARTQVRHLAEEVTGVLAPDAPEMPLRLKPLKAGETLTAGVRSKGEGPAPALVLEDFGGKPVQAGNFDGTDRSGTLRWTFDHDASGYRLVLRAPPGEVPEDPFLVRMGLNLPGAVEGDAQFTPGSVLAHAIPVSVGVMLQQITNVDQVAERFGAVAELRMEWQDPALAFRPDDCHCRFKIFTGDGFGEAVAAMGAQWPQFTLLNQQGNRWSQNRNAVIWPDGRALYIERFTTDFQAPDFDFRKFPFDIQDLYIRVGSMLPDTFYVFQPLPGFSGVGTKLGEEEWYVVEDATEQSTTAGQSAFALRFVVKRHLDFYMFRILIPIALIILVSWFTFFLKDYGKRVDVAGANLLVFVAFNFTISGELPRLGYLTFMDALLIGTFVISAFVVMFNVYLKRLELEGHKETAERLDRSSIWIYPAAYALGAAIAGFRYFVV